MNRHAIPLTVCLILAIASNRSCREEFLEITPNELTDEAVLATFEGVDGLLIGAYAMLDGASSGFRSGWESATSGWLYGSVRGMEANHGSDVGDSSPFPAIQNYKETSDHPYLNAKWEAVYEGIARCNAALRTAYKALDVGSVTVDEYDLLTGQARALRGYYHFEAFRIWADLQSGMYVPYVDEYTDFKTLTNTVDIRPEIIGDLKDGTDLPPNMGQVGRFNRTVCQVLLAKAYMQMYGEYSLSLVLLDDAANNGTNPVGHPCSLEPKYGDAFDIESRNGVESVYTVQYSVNDGSGGWNGGWGEVLNYPYAQGESPGGCCGFYQPTQDFVNSFRTDQNGLPYLDSYNEEKVTNDQGVAPGDPYDEYSGRLDPRLDWSVGRRGIPYWDWGDHPGAGWIREQSYGGPYSPKKQVYKKSQEGIYTEAGSWTNGFTANGYRMIRYAEVLLLRAECEAMTGADDLGLGEVNAVRSRAANPKGFVTELDSITPAANYIIGTYPSFPDRSYALKAIKFERKLELGMEGHRYYDLQRWGEVVEELSRILAYEKTMEWGYIQYLDAKVGPEDVNFPLPQNQINLHQGRFVQNR